MSFVSKVMKNSVLRKNLGPLGGLVGVFVLFVVLLAVSRGYSFADPGNLETLLRQTAIVAIAALGMTMVIVSGGIDLSVGAIIALTTVVIAACMQAGWPPLVAALCGIVTAMACGAMNGILVTRLKVVPFIVTLGTMLVVRGLAKGIAHDQKIDAPKSWLNELLARLPDERAWMIVPAGVWMLFAFAFFVGGILLYTRLGRHIFAVGSNEQAARLCGVAVDRGPRRPVAVLAADGRRSDRRDGPRAQHHRGRGHWGRQSCRRGGVRSRMSHRCAHHAGHQLGLLTDGVAELGARDRNRSHHHHRRGAGPLASPKRHMIAPVAKCLKESGRQ
jgi:ABC-type xylose transport system permease subunit